MPILCGTCAWADHHNFYPAKIGPRHRLAYYARFFPLVEIDSSYYNIPQKRHVQQWVDSTPQNFVFDMKAYRTLTLHDQNLSISDIRMDVQPMQEAAEVLRTANKLGALLFQFPPWFIKSSDSIAYLSRIRNWFASDVLAIEFRHRSWWADVEVMLHTLALLKQHEFINVVCDEPQLGMGTIPFVPDVTFSNMVVFRLHGRNQDTWYQKGLASSQQRFDYKYSMPELQDLANHVWRWSQQADSVHVLMNNNQADYAVANAFDWLQILGLEQQTRPAPSGHQMSLFDGLE